MKRDSRYDTLRDLLAGGYIKNFHQIFGPVPKSVVYRDLGMNYVRFEKLLAHPDLFTFREIKAMADLIGCDPKVLMDLIYLEMMKKRKGLK